MNIRTCVNTSCRTVTYACSTHDMSSKGNVLNSDRCPGCMWLGYPLVKLVADEGYVQTEPMNEEPTESASDQPTAPDNSVAYRCPFIKRNRQCTKYINGNDNTHQGSHMIQDEGGVVYYTNEDLKDSEVPR